MELNFNSLSTKMLKFQEQMLLHLIDDFAAKVFVDWEDPIFNGLHDLLFALQTEIERREDEGCSF